MWQGVNLLDFARAVEDHLKVGFWATSSAAGNRA
jgi:hypothetical protein